MIVTVSGVPREVLKFLVTGKYLAPFMKLCTSLQSPDTKKKNSKKKNLQDFAPLNGISACQAYIGVTKLNLTE